MTIDLSALDPKERKALFDRLAYEFKSGGKRGDSFSVDETDLWDALMAVLKLKQPLGKFCESFGRAKYAEAATAAREYVDMGCGALVRRPVRQVVLLTCLDALRSHLARRHIPTAPASMLNSIPQLGHAVDLRFPGYADARLLHRVAPLRETA